MAPPNITMPMIVELLEHSDMTPQELVAATGRPIKAIEYNLRNMKAAGQVHIAEYLPPVGRGAHAPVYRIGAGEDGRKSTQTKKERRRAQRLSRRSQKVRRQAKMDVGNPFGVLMAQLSQTIIVRD